MSAPNAQNSNYGGGREEGGGGRAPAPTHSFAVLGPSFTGAAEVIRIVGTESQAVSLCLHELYPSVSHEVI